MKKVAIVGSAESWSYAPFDDLSVEIWTFNHLMFERVPRFNRYFDLHIPYKNYYKSFPKYTEFLEDNQKKLYIMDKYPELPKAKIIRWKKLLKIFKHKYFTSSMAWILATAIVEGYDEIFLFGIDLLCTFEYEKQKPCLEYLIGYAEGKGIKVHIQESSNLMKPQALYGIEG